MSLRILDLEQRSPEWYAARCGMVTASSMSTLISVGPPDAKTIACPNCNAEIDGPCLNARAKVPTPIKTIHTERTTAASNLPPVYAPATGDTAKALILALAAERITHYTEDNFTSRDMERGIFAEPFARDMYSEHHAPAVEVGFMVRDFDGFSIGYSPDGLVGDDGLIEIKAPRQKGELATILAGEVPATHAAQIQTGLLVSGRKWLDFVSYCGGMPLFVKRVFPDPKWQDAIIAATQQAEDEIASHLALFEKNSAGLPVAERIDFDDLGLVFS